jgi:hypothetical protein
LPILDSAKSVRPAAVLAQKDGFALLLITSPNVRRSSMLLRIVDGSGKTQSEHALFDDPPPPPDPQVPEGVRQARFYSMRAAIASRPGGGFLVAAARYEIGRSTVWIQRTSADGSPEGASIQLAEMRDATGASVRIVVLHDSAVVLWITPDEGEHERLFARAVDLDGNPTAEVRELLPALHHDSIALANPEFDVAAVSGRAFAVVWAEDGRRSIDILEQEFGADLLPVNRRLQIAGGEFALASKPMMMPVADGLAILWREKVRNVSTLRGATLGQDRNLSKIVDIETGRFADAALARNDKGLMLTTLDNDRAGVALKVRELTNDLHASDDPLVETAGGIDVASVRVTNAAVVWSHRDELDHTRVSLATLSGSE